MKSFLRPPDSKRQSLATALFLLLLMWAGDGCPAVAQAFTLVELNCENLFDTCHDYGRQDTEYLPGAVRHWNRGRYWRKQNHTAQAILSCAIDEGIPDLVALCEVENDSVVRDLTRRSLLRQAKYDYLTTTSPDLRGIDVALLYSPFTFGLLSSYALRVAPVEGMRPTRDILYAKGVTNTGAADTLHVFVVHLPSRFGGERYSRPFRQAAVSRLCQAIDSIQALTPEANILIAGDFNDEPGSPLIGQILDRRLCNVTAKAAGANGVRGTYRYKGAWNRIDHILASRRLASLADTAFIQAPLFLLEEDTTYGGYKPRRTYNGMRYQPGYSDHLPLVARFRWGKRPIPSKK